MRVESVVSNCVFILAEIHSEQVEGVCTQLRVSWLVGNASAYLVSAQMIHSI